jgi:hypothetical protein
MKEAKKIDAEQAWLQLLRSLVRIEGPVFPKLWGAQDVVRLGHSIRMHNGDIVSRILT